MIESQDKRKTENGEGKLRNRSNGGRESSGESAGVPPTGLLTHIDINTQ